MQRAARFPRSFPLAIATLVALATSLPVAAQQPLLADGALAPDFASIDAAGTEVRLASFAGKVVVLDFWATWCGPCLQALPHVQEVAKAHREHGVVVLAVCTSDTRARFTDWVQKHQAEYPDVVFTCDPHDRGSDHFEERASSKLYHVAGLPTKFVIGKDGKVAMGIVGHEQDDRRLEAGLARAGLPIDPAIAQQGEATAKKVAAEDALRAAQAAAAKALPPFQPRLMGYKTGDALPDLTLLGADGVEFALSSLRGKPVVIAAAPAEGLPKRQLQEIATRYGQYGVRALGMVTHTSREDYLAWAKASQGKYTFLTGSDPVGAYAGPEDQEARMAHHEKTLLGRLFGSGMYPAMPFLFVLDAEGKLVGNSLLDERMHEGLANLLLRAGVKLDAAHLPQQVAGPEAFVVAPPPPPEATVAPIQDGAVAPDFATQDLAGTTVKLADFAGKVVVLDFWATWCGPCKQALPHVQQVAAKYKDQGVVVLAACTGDSRAAFEQFVRALQGEYPDVRFVHDPLEKKPERASRALYGVSGIPHQIVIGRDGRIAAQVSGYLQGEVLLDAALAKAGIAVDAAILEQAKVDQQKRDTPRGKATVPAVPMVPMVPVPGRAATPAKKIGG